MDEYLLVRVPRRWVPGWLWRLATAWTPLARLLSYHDPAACGCYCHATSVRDCAFCEPTR